MVVNLDLTKTFRAKRLRVREMRARAGGTKGSILEWTNHEPAGLQVGLEQEVIDVVKHDRDVEGLSPADATFITFGREPLLPMLDE